MSPDQTIDWICTVALLGPRTPVRRMARILDMNPSAVQQTIDKHAENYRHRWWDNDWFRAMFNPVEKRVVQQTVSDYVIAHLANPDHGDECIPYPYQCTKGVPHYKNRDLRWVIYEVENPGAKAVSKTHTMQHSCGDKTCINRGHFSPVKRKLKTEQHERFPDLSGDPLYRAWRK